MEYKSNNTVTMMICISYVKSLATARGNLHVYHLLLWEIIIRAIIIICGVHFVDAIDMQTHLLFIFIQIELEVERERERDSAGAIAIRCTMLDFACTVTHFMQSYKSNH